MTDLNRAKPYSADELRERQKACLANNMVSLRHDRVLATADLLEKADADLKDAEDNAAWQKFKRKEAEAKLERYGEHDKGAAS